MLKLARQGVFHTIQGEGVMLGVPMTFVRLAGCSVGCKQCDTNYQPHEEKDVRQVAGEIVQAGRWGQWVWITGGEPADQAPDVEGLVTTLLHYGCRVAIATAGVGKIDVPASVFVSVSPHDMGRWVLRSGDQLNIVPGLNGFDPFACYAELMRAARDFRHCFATPLYGDAESLAMCRRLVDQSPGWRLGVQAHRMWGVA